MKFKKQICIFLAFFLLVSSTGFSFNIHFCGDKLSSVSVKSNFIKPDSHKSCCAVVEKKESCCNDKVFNFHKSIEQLIVKSFSSQITLDVLIPELNNGQLIKIIRDKYFVDAKGYNKIMGIPFTRAELVEEVKRLLLDVEG